MAPCRAQRNYGSPPVGGNGDGRPASVAGPRRLHAEEGATSRRPKCGRSALLSAEAVGLVVLRVSVQAAHSITRVLLRRPGFGPALVCCRRALDPNAADLQRRAIAH